MKLLPGLRLLIVAGILLAALGAFIAFEGLHFHTKGTVSVGPIYGTVHAQNAVPPLLGWAAMVAGVLLIIAGSRGKKR